MIDYYKKAILQQPSSWIRQQAHMRRAMRNDGLNLNTRHNVLYTAAKNWIRSNKVPSTNIEILRWSKDISPQLMTLYRVTL